MEERAKAKAKAKGTHENSRKTVGERENRNNKRDNKWKDKSLKESANIEKENIK